MSRVVGIQIRKRDLDPLVKPGLRGLRTSEHFDIMNDRLWYTEPASRWINALPIGTGRLAAMVMGTVKRDRLALNHEWLGKGFTGTSDQVFARGKVPPGQSERFGAAKQFDRIGAQKKARESIDSRAFFVKTLEFPPTDYSAWHRWWH